jgi:hypothetical protein
VAALVCTVSSCCITHLATVPLHVSLAAFAGSDPSGVTWQPWADQVVYAVLGGLVWGGDRLAAAAQEHGRAMAAVETYMEARPIKVC